MSDTPSKLTIGQRLDHICTLAHNLQVTTRHYSQKPSAPIVWREIADVLEQVDQDLASLVNAMDTNTFCRACRDSFAQPEEMRR